MAWSEDRCMSCDDLEHDECDGLMRVVDQDGRSDYMCKCPCNRETIEVSCGSCRGSGKISRESFTKNVGNKP